MDTITFMLNGKRKTLSVDPQMPRLWAILDTVSLRGTK